MLTTRSQIAVAADAIAANGGWNPGAGDELVMVLFKNDPTLTIDSVVGDITMCDFPGYAPKACGAGDPTAGINPVTGGWEIRPREPLGGFEWTTGAPDATIPQTVFGYALCTEDLATLMAFQKFDDPIVLTAQFQVVDVPQPILQLPQELFVAP